MSYDPKKPKQLTIYVALTYPGWQEKYIDLVRAAFDNVSLKVDDKAVNVQVAKLGEVKKAMPFVQNLKKRLATESSKNVFDRKLAFDEVATLKEAVPTLMKITGAKVVSVVIVEDGGKTGKDLDRKTLENLPAQAEGAEPGNPKFEFTNIK